VGVIISNNQHNCANKDVPLHRLFNEGKIKSLVSMAKRMYIELRLLFNVYYTSDKH